MAGLTLAHLIRILFEAYYLVLLLRVIASFFPPPARHSPWARLLGFAWVLTEPLLRPIRGVLHPYQRSTPLDFSPLVLMVLLSVVERILLTLLRGMG